MVGTDPWGDLACVYEWGARKPDQESSQTGLREAGVNEQYPGS